MIPKTEHELELYFLLEDLKQAHEVSQRSIWQHGSVQMMEIAHRNFNELKSKYLTRANQDNNEDKYDAD